MSTWGEIGEALLLCVQTKATPVAGATCVMHVAVLRWCCVGSTDIMMAVPTGQYFTFEISVEAALPASLRAPAVSAHAPALCGDLSWRLFCAV